MYRSIYVHSSVGCLPKASTLTMENKEHGYLNGLEENFVDGLNREAKDGKVTEKLKELEISMMLVREKLKEMIASLKNVKWFQMKHLPVFESIEIICEVNQDNIETIANLLIELHFLDVAVKVFRQMNRMGMCKKIDQWEIATSVLNVCRNCSHKSERMAMDFAESGAVKILIWNLRHTPYAKLYGGWECNKICRSMLSILHNVAKCVTSKYYFTEEKISEALMPLIGVTDEYIRCLAILILAYTIDEADVDEIVDETGIIMNIVSWISSAMEEESRHYMGFAPWELIQGLSRLALNDYNKEQIVDVGALEVLLNVVCHNDPHEQSCVAQCLWTLAFDEDVRQAIRDFPGLVQALEKLQNTGHVDLNKNVFGALWTIRGDTSSDYGPQLAISGRKHIFISYCWADKIMVHKIFHSLVSAGYQVWIDLEQMKGSTLQAMAEAVENAAVVLLCMSEKYQNSLNCRTEAEYTYKLKRDYIPLIMQSKYSPDSWLGAIAGTKLYFDFSGKYSYDDKFQDLLHELQDRGKAKSPGVMFSATTSSACKENISKNAGIKTDQKQSDDRLITKGLDWLQKILPLKDQQMITYIKNMKEKAPDYFYNSLEKQYGMTLPDIIELCAALDSLI